MLAKLHLLPPEKYPVTIKLLSRKRKVPLWSCTLQLPDKGTLGAVRIPGFGGTIHTPVGVRIEYADGTADEEWPDE